MYWPFSERIYLLSNVVQLVGADGLRAGVKVKKHVHLNSSGLQLSSGLQHPVWKLQHGLPATKPEGSILWEQVLHRLLDCVAGLVLQVWVGVALLELPGILLEMRMVRFFELCFNKLCWHLRHLIFEGYVCVCVAPLEADAFVAETELPAPDAVG